LSLSTYENSSFTAGTIELELTAIVSCRINNGILLFKDQESTQRFVDNISSPDLTTSLKTLWIQDCGVSVTNQPLMAGIHKNTTLLELGLVGGDAATRRFIEPILVRSRDLGHVHNMLVGANTTTLPLPSSSTTFPAGVGEIAIVATPTIPPPCGLWATVMAKVGKGT
jgi:hypothetical protein